MQLNACYNDRPIAYIRQIQDFKEALISTFRQ